MGQPIISYSIEVAIASKCFDRVIVSTDDSEIAEVAKSFNADVPFVRPKPLADDFAGTGAVMKHAIEWFESVGLPVSHACCIYATAPFIQTVAIAKAYQQFIGENADYCFTVTNFPAPIQRAIKITENNRLDMFFPDNYSDRSQDLEDAWHDAGQFYWGKAEAFKQQKLLFSRDSTPFILPPHLVQDIDTPEDWKRAEIAYQVLKQLGEID